MVYHLTLRQQCQARDGISATTQCSLILRYTQIYYNGIGYELQQFFMCKDELQPLEYIRGAVWTYTGASFLVFSLNFPVVVYSAIGNLVRNQSLK